MTATVEDDRLAAIAELLRKADALPGAAPAPVALGEHMVEAARVPRRHREALLRLTPMELTCVRFLGWGRSNADIATLLMISDNTVRVHLSNVARKLELDGMRELAALAGLLFYPAD
ncbi:MULTISPECIES: LuxR C-terminal-related transcriptional regulator [Sphingomonas]|uniref:LuxR family transcriptional regulator n=1 Tax=Sphingomonas adhaesiva TaxID=28212 RepID=A0A2A4I6C2_9SPHN|nr:MULTISPECIES: LuxR C-terminal-related transcriptional regulator [Sphingomonas]PCG14035.1 LuxR family transcriptional regulator [Sphingomonas adhaesiva]PZU82066.1 MAG: LuxR family transcriptional regulator [Sphingomonas sp.]